MSIRIRKEESRLLGLRGKKEGGKEGWTDAGPD